MKALGILALAAAPLATLTVWGFRDTAPSPRPTAAAADAAGAPSPAAIARKMIAWDKPHENLASAIADADPWSPAELAGLQSLPPDSPLAPLERTWPAWTAARAVVDEFFGLPAGDPQGDLDALRADKGRWEAFARKLRSADLPASDALAALVDRRLNGLERQIARREAQADAAAAAEAVTSAFAAAKYDEGLARSRQWLATYAGSASSSVTEEIKALQLRAEFETERERSRGRLKAAASPAQREAVLAAFLDRFSSAADRLTESERAVVERCRKYLEAQRAKEKGSGDEAPHSGKSSKGNTYATPPVLPGNQPPAQGVLRVPLGPVVLHGRAAGRLRLPQVR